MSQTYLYSACLPGACETYTVEIPQERQRDHIQADQYRPELRRRSETGPMGITRAQEDGEEDTNGTGKSEPFVQR